MIHPRRNCTRSFSEAVNGSSCAPEVPEGVSFFACGLSLPSLPILSGLPGGAVLVPVSLDGTILLATHPGSKATLPRGWIPDDRFPDGLTRWVSADLLPPKPGVMPCLGLQRWVCRCLSPLNHLSHLLQYFGLPASSTAMVLSSSVWKSGIYKRQRACNTNAQNLHLRHEVFTDQIYAEL